MGVLRGYGRFRYRMRFRDWIRRIFGGDKKGLGEERGWRVGLVLWMVCTMLDERPV